MIYVIDDKVIRQRQDFGWNEKSLIKYDEAIEFIHDLETLEQAADKVFQTGNTVLYHESFLDNSTVKGSALEKRAKLERYAESNKGFYLVLFSGSKNSREWKENIAHAPVSVVYQNLGTYADKCRSGISDLGYLLFGSNPKIEEQLMTERDMARGNIIAQPPANLPEHENLWIKPFEGHIGNPLATADKQTLFNDVSDEHLSSKIEEWLSEKKYDNIFIPLCFGQTLSDFNGLRLATMIRCTESKNQLSKIIIYGCVGVEYLWNHPYFNILKTKNVHLVEFNKHVFEEVGKKSPEEYRIDQLPIELAKLKLDLPKNYDDNHSVINEWAIDQWAKTIGADEAKELVEVSETVGTNLYFKYLKALHPVSKTEVLSDSELKIAYSGTPKILLVDDEAEKGWNEILANILTDINGVWSDALGEGFRKMDQDEIVNHVIKKVEEEEIDVVILDYRLNAEDFENSDIDEMTSVKLLKKIKQSNPGIQVIMFSASNDANLLQSLNELGQARIDGFVNKGVPGTIMAENIKAFVSVLETAINRRFLKNYFERTRQIKSYLSSCDREDDTDFDDFVMDLEKQVLMLETSMLSIDLKSSSTLDIVFLSCFNFLEKFKKQFLSEQNGLFFMGEELVKLKKYTKDQNARGKLRFKDLGVFVKKDLNDPKPSWFHSMAGLFIDYFKVDHIVGKHVKALWEIKEARNDYIHNRKSFFNQTETLKVLDLCLKSVEKMKE